MPVDTVSIDQVERDSNGKPYRIAPPQQYYGRRRQNRCRAKQTTPRLDLVKEGEPVALDVEGVILPDEFSIGKCGVARASVTNASGAIVIDTFMHFPSEVNCYPPPAWLNLGVLKNDLKPWNGARPVSEVLADIEKIFDKSGIVVCHSIDNEIHYMSPRTLRTKDGDKVHTYSFDLTKYEIYDTQMFEEYRAHGKWPHYNPALRDLAEIVLKRSIQMEEHSSVEDAQATMDLYLRRKDQFKPIKYSSHITKVIPESLDELMAAEQLVPDDADIDDVAEDQIVASTAASKTTNPPSFADIAAG